ncbi:MAG TPA: HAMP domain-containing sensor histidine kinase [Caulobacteraceae bacterium]|jgi:signal transduction histidine kinase|nr:HAMP domain-containing sensor histidine kinase [Caulobacteraceae bacterium]
MADTAPSSEPARWAPGGFRWPGGLSSRLLLLTVLIVVFANLLILPPNLAAFEEQRLRDRLNNAEVATLVTQTAPNGVVSDPIAQKLLASAEVVQVSVGVNNERHLILQMPRVERAPYLVDLRQNNPLSWMTPFETLSEGGNRMVRVMARPRFLRGDFVEIVAPNGPLKKEIFVQLERLLGIALFTSIMAGGVVYFSLNFLLVRPMQRITRSMEHFRADPDDASASVKPSNRPDEIGRAERELERMQTDLRVALSSRARLAALGEAVAKINHDLRNMLTSAQLASERMSASGDPNVAQALPRLERALGRAATLASNVLTFGKSEEPPPQKRPVDLRPALTAAAEDAGLSTEGVPMKIAFKGEPRISADPEQLHRILVNLLTNARQAIDQAGRGSSGRVSADYRQDEDMDVIVVADNGPGLPERARTHLFQAFAGSAREGGSGLGLAIARELAQGHGGELSLIDTGPEGTIFELRLPKA